MEKRTLLIRNYRTRYILGVKVNFVDLKTIINRVEELVKYNKKGQITTPNPEHIIICQNDYRFKKIINQSIFSVPDGIGVILAAKLRGDNFGVKKKRLSGIDLMLELLKLANKKRWPVFLLGGAKGVAEKTADKLSSKYKHLKIGWLSGPAEIEKADSAELRNIIAQINKFAPRLLFAAFGAPKQEKWIADNLKKLNVNLAMGVGGAFDYLAGKAKRPPEIIRKAGLEWLWRLIHQPWRLKRQLRLLKFAFLVIFSNKKANCKAVGK